MSSAQKAELQKLLVEQQDPSSANYRHWLTPEEYASRFGASQSDIEKVEAWSRLQGLQIAAVARSRNWIAVSGSAAAIEGAFRIELHQYVDNGKTHFANANEPSVPSAFASVVINIHGLSDFRMKPKGRLSSLAPRYNDSGGSHYLAPDDLAVIYNIQPLLSDSIDGKGMKLVVAGQTEVNISDIEAFRSKFNLPSNDPTLTLVPNSQDPGISQDDLPEADLDLEWSGAVARNASIQYVYTTDVLNSVQYAIDQDLAPVISISYGLCELETPTSDAFTLQSWAEQANAEGITWLAASGDSGAADCNDSQNPGLAVDLPASIPQVTGVGGTEFAETGSGYWSSTNTSNHASALSYIPETAWNDSATDGEPAASGGGASVLFTKPSWQTGTGVPADNARDVPDVALSASADHDGYFVYTGGQWEIYGGTSVPAPSFAGLTVLLNQALVAGGKITNPGLGNINSQLYSLAKTASSAFHDITTGNNIVTVSCGQGPASGPGPGQSGCTASAVGYSAGAGYDQVTGLGSVDAFKLVSAWSGGSVTTSSQSTVTMTLVANVNALAATQVAYLVATVTSSDGITPTGSVAFSIDGSSLGSAVLSGSAGTATGTLSITGSQLPSTGGTITASYGGDTASSSGTASVTLTVRSTPAISSIPAINGLTNGASFKSTFAPGMIMSLFGSLLAPSTLEASSTPLPVSMAGVGATVNGVAAPFYYVSPTQINLQIPYEVATGTATLNINNNGQVTSQSFTVTDTAPGIFINESSQPVPSTTATRGQIVTLYITGAGRVSPAVATGAAPAAGTATADLPQPTHSVSMTVGGVEATIEFIGIPSAIVGAVQINYLVPSGIATGAQPVIVTANGVASSPAYLSITN